MKNRFLAGLLILIAGLLFGQSPASGQISKSDYQVSIPFEFRVGNKVYPAGEYRVRPLNAVSNGNMVVFQSKGGEQKQVLVLTPETTVGRNQAPVMTFIKFEGGFFLSEIKTEIFAGKYRPALPKTMLRKKGADRSETVAINLHN